MVRVQRAVHDRQARVSVKNNRHGAPEESTTAC